MKPSNKEILFAAISFVDKEELSEGCRQDVIMSTIDGFNELFNDCDFEPHNTRLEYIRWKDAQ